MIVRDLGRVPYGDAHEIMGQTLEARLAGTVPDTLLLCEHDPVFTLGRRRDAAENVLMPGDIPVVSIERGGDVTYHGPGQLVGYPIVALPPHRQDIHGFLRFLEATLIEVLEGFSIEAGRDPRNTGVWVQGRKIAAMGIACRRWVTWHGFALNVDLPLEPYQRINPCGLDSSLVTRMVDHGPVEISQVRETISQVFPARLREWLQPS